MKRGLGGIPLFEGDEAGATRRIDGIHGFAKLDETFVRRLADARAFGHASHGLASQRPDLSAKAGLTIAQRAIGWSLSLVYLFFLFARTAETLAISGIVLGAAFSLIIMLRIAAAIHALLPSAEKVRTRTPDSQLWTLTLLIPLHKEGPTVVRGLVNAIAALDYPVGKLDVKILIEADDSMTLQAVLAANPPQWFEIVPVPPGDPRTKPKALNYGLASARGRVVAVFDAEDRPSPDQPRAAMAAFQSDGGNLAVVQAPLLIHNGKDGWLAQQFEVEYAIHFRVWLPFLARLGLPLALGGTSNYFRRDRLEKAGGWDAWNVTEDADVGLRLARFGGSARVITPPTYEEAPAQMRPWLSQRTRWMKGHLQTWIVIMRRPLQAAREMGLLRFMATQVTFGGSLLASAMHAPLLVWVVACAFRLANFELWHGVLFTVGYGSVLAAAIAARAVHAKPWTLATVPLYWPLQSLAMLLALIDMHYRPQFWAKTPHSGMNPATAPSRPQTAPDNIIQLEFPFPDQDRAISP